MIKLLWKYSVSLSSIRYELIMKKYFNPPLTKKDIVRIHIIDTQLDLIELSIEILYKLGFRNAL